MYSYHTAPWYPRYDERDRITHQKRTKQREKEEQRLMGRWTWEEILDGAGPWTQRQRKRNGRYYEEKYRRIEDQRRYEGTRQVR
jgi:hypothetical protein